jgi:hypothetical protein
MKQAPLYSKKLQVPKDSEPHTINISGENLTFRPKIFEKKKQGGKA